MKQLSNINFKMGGWMDERMDGRIDGILTSLYHKQVTTATNTEVKCTYGTG